MQLFLAVTPQEVRDASQYTRSFAHVAYRIGPESTLLRRDLLLDTKGGLMSLSDRDAPAVDDPEKLTAAVLRECLRRSYGGAVLDFEEPSAGDRRKFAEVLAAVMTRNHRSVFLPESYAVSGGTALINTALSGGNYYTRLQEAQSRYGQNRTALDVQRLAMDFTLPARTGEGQPMTVEKLRALMDAEAPAVFFSQDLCARYFTYTRNGETHFILYDDADTLLQKIRIGGSLGYRAALLMYPEVSDLLGKLFGQWKNA